MFYAQGSPRPETLGQLLAFLCLLIIAGVVPAAAAETKFSHAGVEADAKRYETYLRANWLTRDKAARQLRDDGAKALTAGTDFRAAARSFAQAVVMDPADSETWTSLARALLAIKADNGSERYELPSNASGAAWLAYARATTPKDKVAALWILHEALKRRSYYRPAFFGWANYNINGGGDFGITQAPDMVTCGNNMQMTGFDHQDNRWRMLNCGCKFHYLYSYSATLDGDAGYDAGMGFGSWEPTVACASAEGGSLLFYAAMR